MSTGFNMEVSSDEHEATYERRQKGRCIYIIGSIPVDELVALAKGKEGYFMSPYLAQKFGASVFFGPKEEIDELTLALKKQDKEDLEKAIADGMDPAKAWLKHGEVGASSKFMCEFLSGLNPSNSAVYAPADYDDFQRCEKMLRIVPGLREKMHTLSQFPQYEKLIPKWEKLAERMDLICAQKDTVHNFTTDLKGL